MWSSTTSKELTDEQTDQHLPQMPDAQQSGQVAGLHQKAHDGHLHGHTGRDRLPQGARVHNLKETTMQAPQPQAPAWLATKPSLLNPNWRYVPAADTNIMERFRAMGWVPPSEAKK
jgi:hypothetical protein